MVDLFGEEVAVPTCSPDYGFEEAWAVYPPGERRVAKKQCRAKWAKNGLAQQAPKIIAHIHHMKTEDSWLRGFVPMFATYINQERWIDWEPVVKLERPLVDPALAKIREDDKKAAPLSDEMRRKLAELRGKR